MANRLKMVQKELLFALFSQNWSNRKINNTLGIHRNTIAQYKKEWLDNLPEGGPDKTGIKQPFIESFCPAETIQNVPLPENQVPPDGVVHFEVPPDSENIVSKSKAAVFHDIITNKLENGQQARSIFQDLVIDHEFNGSYDSIKRYIRKLKKRTPDLYARIETPPGEEAQVDFGEGAPTLKNGKYRKPWLFVMTLSNSRKSYEESVWTQDVETFIQCHENAFTSFGGVSKVVKIDNLKSGVLKAHLYEPELNPNYLAFAEHCGFIPLPCRVRKPEHKGKVESNVGYVQSNALKGKKFDSLEKQNTYLKHWNRTWASTRIHGTTKRQVELMFREEKPSLLPLPESTFQFFKIGSRKVSSADSHIEVAGAYYPVPPKYMGKRVQVHFNKKWVKVFHNQELIQHLSTVKKGYFHPDKSCLPAHKNWSQENYAQYLMNRCAFIGPSVLEWAKQAELQRPIRAIRSIQGIVALSKKYPSSVVNAACRHSIEQNVYSYHIVKEQAEFIRIQKEIQEEIRFTQESHYIRSPEEYHKILNGETNG